MSCTNFQETPWRVGSWYAPPSPPPHDQFHPGKQELESNNMVETITQVSWMLFQRWGVFHANSEPRGSSIFGQEQHRFYLHYIFVQACQEQKRSIKARSNVTNTGKSPYLLHYYASMHAPKFTINYKTADHNIKVSQQIVQPLLLLLLIYSYHLPRSQYQSFESQPTPETD